jgi:hypothetical protein
MRHRISGFDPLVAGACRIKLRDHAVRPDIERALRTGCSDSYRCARARRAAPGASDLLTLKISRRNAHKDEQKGDLKVFFYGDKRHDVPLDEIGEHTYSNVRLLLV